MRISWSYESCFAQLDVFLWEFGPNNGVESQKHKHKRNQSLYNPHVLDKESTLTIIYTLFPFAPKFELMTFWLRVQLPKSDIDETLINAQSGILTQFSPKCTSDNIAQARQNAP